MLFAVIMAMAIKVGKKTTVKYNKTGDSPVPSVTEAKRVERISITDLSKSKLVFSCFCGKFLI